MKQYPKIEHHHKGIFGSYCYAFDKLDGSNIRLEWNKKRGWYKFGTRNNIIDERDPQFGESITIFMEKYSDDLTRIFKDTKEYRNSDSFVAFCEFLGENSFSGQHIPSDKKDMVLFDINQYKKGFLSPSEFIDNFGHLDIPKVIWSGNYGEDLIEMIQNMTDLKEGVVVKGVLKTKGSDQVWMSKIKTFKWLKKIKEMYGEKAILEEFNFDKSMVF